MPDGVSVITKKELKGKLKEMINNFGHISAALQRIDIPVTYDWNIKQNDFTLFLYGIKGRPIGLLTTDLNKERKIMAGSHPLKIIVLGRSPVFGPSPTRAIVYIGLQSESDIASSPIKSYLVLGQKK